MSNPVEEVDPIDPKGTGCKFEINFGDENAMKLMIDKILKNEINYDDYQKLKNEEDKNKIKKLIDHILNLYQDPNNILNRKNIANVALNLADIIE
jgi:hypothetical protein